MTDRLSQPDVWSHLASFAATQGDVWIRHFLECAQELYEDPEYLERCRRGPVEPEIAAAASAYSRSIRTGPAPVLDESGRAILGRLCELRGLEPDETRLSLIEDLLVREICYRFFDRLHGFQQAAEDSRPV